MSKKILCVLLIISLITGCSKKEDIPSNMEIGLPIQMSTDLFPEQEIESAVSNAILTRNENAYYKGEVQTEGHKILGTAKIDENQLKVYCIVNCGEFGFENDIFTKISGSGTIPTVITLSKDELGCYSLIEYEEPQDGTYYGESIKSMFPVYIYPYVFDSEKYNGDLLAQEEAYAKRYLVSIGRDDSVVSGKQVEKTLSTSLGMDVLASNKLLGMFGEYPYWLGTQERLEDNIRYIYRKEYDADNKIVTYTKEEEDDTVVDKYVIDTTDGELIFLEGTPRPRR